jgi:hypothetical protein
MEDDDIKIKDLNSIADIKLENLEIETKQCKVCLEFKPRIRAGNFNARDKKWRGTDGSLWNGLSCPSCHKGKVSERLRKKRSSDI